MPMPFAILQEFGYSRAEIAALEERKEIVRDKLA
jgi:hypothetical protein